MPADALTIAVPLQTRDERRRGERVEAVMPITFEGHESTTVDLSSSGLSFDADRPYAPGSRIEVVIEYLLDGHHYPLRCVAEVVRSEARGGRYTIAARLQAQDATEVAVGPADATGRSHLRPVDSPR